MGEKKTPDSFRAACTVFTELENLLESASSGAMNKEAIETDIINIITKNDNRGKQTSPGEIGSRLQSKYPDFDIRTFGYSQLSKFLEDMPGIELTKRNNSMSVSLHTGEEEEDKILTGIREIVRKRGKNGIGLSTLGQEIRKMYHGFDVRLYGYTQLYKFIDAIPGLKVTGSSQNRKVVIDDAK